MGGRIFILDGYNVIHAAPAWAGLLDVELARARDALCAYCAEWIVLRGDVASFVVVFDGDSSVKQAGRETWRGVRIVFTETGETADRRIVEMIEDLPARRDRVVVSNDGEVARQCRLSGVNVMRVSEFVGILKRTKKRKLPRAESESDGLTPAQRDEITRELMKEWGIDGDS